MTKSTAPPLLLRPQAGVAVSAVAAASAEPQPRLPAGNRAPRSQLQAPVPGCAELDAPARPGRDDHPFASAPLHSWPNVAAPNVTNEKSGATGQTSP